LDDPRIRAELRGYVQSDAPWLTNFLIFAIGDDLNFSSAARLLVEAGPLPDAPVYRQLERQLLDRLVSAGMFDQAAGLYLSLRGTDPSRLIRTDLERRDIDRRDAGIGWQLLEEPARNADWTTNAKGNLVLRAHAFSNQPDVVARKLLFLRPGAYRLSAELVNISLAGGAADLEIRCGIGAHSRIAWRSPALPDGPSTRIVGDWFINRDCPHQYVELVIGAGEGTEDASLQLTSVHIEQLMAGHPPRSTKEATYGQPADPLQ
jgi:hypothetical protein